MFLHQAEILIVLWPANPPPQLFYIAYHSRLNGEGVLAALDPFEQPTLEIYLSSSKLMNLTG